MKISSIKDTLQGIPKTAKNAVDTVGSTSIKFAKQAGGFVADKLNVKKPQVADSFVKTVKEKAPGFVKTTGRFVKNNKETFIGAAVMLAAAACAKTIVSGVANKIQEARTEE